jgi:hypothetical protein
MVFSYGGTDLHACRSIGCLSVAISYIPRLGQTCSYRGFRRYLGFRYIRALGRARSRVGLFCSWIPCLEEGSGSGLGSLALWDARKNSFVGWEFLPPGPSKSLLARGVSKDFISTFPRWVGQRHDFPRWVESWCPLSCNQVSTSEASILVHGDPTELSW